MATAGTNITALAKPAVGTTAGPQWATDLNSSIDAVDGHDHSTNKGIRITPAAININADMEFNQNSASELKNVIFDSSVTAATTSYSVYQASGNLYWRNGSGTAVQITTAGAVNAGAGSISGMTGTDAGVSYADGSKTFNFFTDSGNEDYGKMAHADLLLFKYTNDNTGDTDYVTIAANSGVSGSSGTIYVPSENGTFLTTATSYAGAIAIATSSGNSNIDLTPHGTGEVNISKVDINGGTVDATTVGAASHTTGKFTTVDATTDVTIGGTVITDGNIADTGTLAIVPVDGCTIALGTDAGDDFNVDSGKLVVEGDTGNVGIASPTPSALLTVGETSGTPVIVLGRTGQNPIITAGGTNTDLSIAAVGTGGGLSFNTNGSNRMTIDAAGKISGANFDINGGTLAAFTIDGNWTAASQTCANLGTVTTADINGGTIDATTVGASSHTTGKFTTVDATTDFTIGGTVITDNTITDDGTLVIAASTATSFSDGNITNVGDIALDTISSDAGTSIGVTLGTDAGDDFNVGSGKLVVEGDTGNVGIASPTPSALLTVGETSGTPVIVLGRTGQNPLITAGGSNTDLSIAAVGSGGGLSFNTNGLGRLSINAAGAVTIGGSLSKGSGSFKIDHPLKPDTHHLVHSFIEGPQADLIYRGVVNLVGGTASINIDEAGRMTEGTFVALCTNNQCFTTNETDWDLIKGSISGNILTISSQNTDCTASISWMVIGERKDQHMIDTEWTDENGRVITEPEKIIVTEEKQPE